MVDQRNVNWALNKDEEREGHHEAASPLVYLFLIAR
jgi:hypothetical protein